MKSILSCGSAVSLAMAFAALLFVSGNARAADANLSIATQSDAVIVKPASGKDILRYVLKRPADSKLSVDSACYFHPFTSPKGVVVTEVAPSDHLHHRGIFLAFVEMHGRKDADFWGWGEHAPKANRAIVNRGVSGARVENKTASFTASNEWRAEDEVIVRETLEASVRIVPGANVIDLRFTLTPTAPIKLSQWAFSGFCVRTRKDGKVEVHNSNGLVSLPNPRHTEPASDWPAAKWYAMSLKLDDGTEAGVTVIDHPNNPPSLWHNHRDVRMLNPCIVAPSALDWKAGSEIVLRYRVVAHDGPVPSELLNRLANEFGGK